MESSILVGMAIVLILFVWVWIGITIVQRLSLEKKIEKLENIENRLPEEERTLNHLKELRAIEQSKVGSAKLILGIFGLGLVIVMGASAVSPFLQELFGLGNLRVFYYFAIVALAFMILPTFVGLTLAGSSKVKALEKKERVNA